MSPDRDSSFMSYVDSFPLSDGKNNLGYISIVIRDCISINNVFCIFLIQSIIKAIINLSNFEQYLYL